MFARGGGGSVLSWDRAPQVVDLRLQKILTLTLTQALLLRGEPRRPLIADDAVIHERVAGVEDQLHLILAVAALTLRDKFYGEYEVVDDRVRVGPGAEVVVALINRIVAVAFMGDDQRLHHLGVLFHEIGDAGIGVYHDFIGQPYLPTTIALLDAQELFAEGPVVVADRHTYR